MTSLSRRAFLLGLGVASLGLSVRVNAGSGVEQFRELSAALTGFPKDRLDPRLARTYLESVTEMEPSSWIRLAASNSSAEALEKALDDPDLSALANRIIEMWYTGIHTTSGGSRVAAFRETLFWQSVDFCHPPTYCGPAWWTS